MIVYIPVDIFTLNTLRYHHQPEDHAPLKTEKHDALFARILVQSFETPKLDAIHLQNSFSETIDLDLPNLIGAKVQKLPFRLGLKLKRYARAIFHEYIYHRHANGTQVTVAIANFCSEHKIELDVDISFEALEKSWKRFFYQKNCEIFDRNRRVSVLLSGRKIHTRNRPILPFSDYQLEDMIQEYRKNHESMFYYKKRGQRPFRQKLNDQLKAYVWHHIGKRSTAFCTKKLKINDRCLRRRVESFKIFLETAPPVI